MTADATVQSSDSLRLFCALTLPGHIREALRRWQGTLPLGAARPIDAANLHVTLAFLGSRPALDVADVAEALRSAVSSVDAAPVLRPLRYRETRSVAMLVLADEDGRAARIAGTLHEALERLGLFRREARPWLPHVTVLRFRRPPRLRPDVPDLAAFSPSGAAVYHSLLRRGGAQYQVLESVSLGG